VNSLYGWLKVIHLFGLIAWMAGIFYLPRLYVYHADAAVGSEASETFKVMERRLLRGIMNPAMIVTWLAGLSLAYVTGAYREPWLMAKVVLVIALSGFHGWLSARRRDFEADRNKFPSRTFRIVNELPTLLLLGILILVVIRPFQ
jgi:putative membrane protein